MIVRGVGAEVAAGEVGHGDQCFGAVVAVGAAGEQPQVGVLAASERALDAGGLLATPRAP